MAVAERPLAGSVVIPAWNEEERIGRTLEQLLSGFDDVLEVIVACNGCTDGTADVVRRSGLPVVLLELPSAGKAAAIRAAEQVAAAMPRLYLDADVALSGRAALDVLAALAAGAVAARPPLQYDVTDASWPVRRFYRQRMRLPSVRADLCGAGVYGLSVEARHRFGDFPDVIGDDLFAARVVDQGEIEIVPTEAVVVAVPRNVASLVRVLGRVQRGNRQLAALFPERVRSTTRSTVREIATSIRRPGHVVDAAVFAVLTVAGRVRARRSRTAWGRDESSREVRR